MRTTDIRNRVVRVCHRCHREVSEKWLGALHGWASVDGEFVCVNGQEPHFVGRYPAAS
jgi:hypothetical protein